MRQAVNSHATVDQAIGVLTAIHRLAQAAGFEVLREVCAGSGNVCPVGDSARAAGRAAMCGRVVRSRVRNRGLDPGGGSTTR
ncbi:ANTAR domain-containing protein [Streptomyces canus]|uniref:ANTAR domain-containing protein n=1 Tax=Streptomyces canus TaxID=58343 RepID=UPI001CEC27DE|nr:ANTAR domain-containing protein [Streptomyces canus]